MMPNLVRSAPAPSSHLSHLSRCLILQHNMPEEDDETMCTAEQDATVSTSGPDSSSSSSSSTLPKGVRLLDEPLHRRRQSEDHRRPPPAAPSYFSSSYQPSRSLPAGFSQPTPFPSQADGPWLHPSLASSWSQYPSSLPSYLSHKEEQCSCAGESCLSACKLPPPPPSQPASGCVSSNSSLSSLSSLEQPLSLCSNPPSANLYYHTLSPYACSPQGAACYAQRPGDAFTWRPRPNKRLQPQYHPPNGTCYPGDCRHPAAAYTHIGHNTAPHSTSLSLEQRRVFVTYEADDDKHVNEIINFVALLRHNGFDTHIDIFEQQFRSISKIDFMERYLSEKEYLIIIIISPKYYETVTASPVGLENDERTFNTVYIHKQLQNEFIQNGSKNFRFIPIVFPGAKKCHVPTWLQNTHVYSWPRDRDDILRRLMRVEKYNPPPIGPLPTIVSIPI